MNIYVICFMVWTRAECDGVVHEQNVLYSGFDLNLFTFLQRKRKEKQKEKIKKRSPSNLYTSTVWIGLAARNWNKKSKRKKKEVGGNLAERGKGNRHWLNNYYFHELMKPNRMIWPSRKNQMQAILLSFLFFYFILLQS